METLTMGYDPKIFAEIIDDPAEYCQIGWTVSGAEDPAVIELSETFRALHPEYAGYSIVRVVDQFVNVLSSDALLEFSNNPMTDREIAAFEDLISD